MKILVRLFMLYLLFRVQSNFHVTVEIVSSSKLEHTPPSHVDRVKQDYRRRYFGGRQSLSPGTDAPVIDLCNFGVR